MLKFTPLDRTPEKTHWLWDNIKRLSQYTLDDDHQERAELEHNLANADNLYFEAQEDGKPIGYVTVLPMTAWSATVHATFFDLRTRGREERLNKLALWVMAHSPYSVLRAVTPATHRSSVALMRRMGWSEDGRVRAAFRRRGQFVDSVLFSITQEELANGRHFRRRQKENEGQDNDRATPRIAGATDSTPQVLDRPYVSGGWDASDFWTVPVDGTASVSTVRPNALRTEDLRTAEQRGRSEPGTIGMAGTEDDLELMASIGV